MDDVRLRISKVDCPGIQEQKCPFPRNVRQVREGCEEDIKAESPSNRLVLLYHDDIHGGMPFLRNDSAISRALTAHFYNTNMTQHGDKLEGLIATKKIKPDQRKDMLFDIERGGADDILPGLWQTDTCK